MKKLFLTCPKSEYELERFEEALDILKRTMKGYEIVQARYFYNGYRDWHGMWNSEKTSLDVLVFLAKQDGVISRRVWLESMI